MRRRFSRGLVGAGFATAVVLSGIVVPTASAQAAPCTASRDYTYRFGAKSQCAPQTYRWWHRVWITCTESGRNKTYYGNYAGGLSISRAQCAQSATKVVSYGVDQGQDD